MTKKKSLHKSIDLDELIRRSTRKFFFSHEHVQKIEKTQS